MKKIGRNIIILSAFLGLANSIVAQEDTTHLREVEILDTVPELEPGLKTIYNADKIKEVQGIQLGDVLQEFPGVYIRDYGGLGGLKTVSLRSLSATHTQIVVDGVPMFNGMNGTVNIGNIPTENLNEIALHYQTKPGLFPASAYAGAGNIFLSTEATQFGAYGKEISASLTGGSFGQWIGNVSGRYNHKDKVALYGQVRYDQLEGNYPYALQNGNEVVTGERLNSDLTAINAFTGGVWKTGKSSQLSWRGQYYQSDRGLPGAVIFYAPNFRQRLEQQHFNFQVNYAQQLKSWRYKITGYHENAHLQYHDPDFLSSLGYLNQTYPSQNSFLSFASKGKINSLFSWKFSTDGLYENIEKTSNHQVTQSTERFRNFSMAGLYFTSLQWTAEASLHSQVWWFEEQWDARLNPAVHVDFSPQKFKKLQFRAFYKRNFRLPTFGELFFNVILPEGLQPETVDQFNIGTTWSPIQRKDAGLLFKVDAYYYDVQNMIIAIPTQNLFIWSVRNLGRVNTHGIDFSIHSFKKTLDENWKVSTTLQYSLQLAKNVTDESLSFYEHQIPYTPAHQWHANAMLEFKNSGIRFSLQWIGERFYMNENIPQFGLGSYFVGDFTGYQKFEFNHHEIQLQMQVRNFSNENYEVIRSFPMPGIQVLGKIIYSWRK